MSAQDSGRVTDLESSLSCFEVTHEVEGAVLVDILALRGTTNWAGFRSRSAEGERFLVDFDEGVQVRRVEDGNGDDTLLREVDWIRVATRFDVQARSNGPTRPPDLDPV